MCPDSDVSIDVSVVLPALDEEGTIERCIRKIQAVFRDNSINGEIIIADSSKDRTPDIAKGLGARVITPKKKGYGNAYLAGFAEARGKIIVMGDSDDTYDFSEIPKLLAPFKDGADLVTGSRFLGTIHPGAMAPLHQYIGNPVLTWLVNAIFHTRFTDTHSGFRAFTREALDRLPLNTGGMEFASEMLIMAAKQQLKIAEVPIDYYPREAPSKLHSFADGWRHARFVLLMRPLPFIAIPGVLFFVVGLVLMGFFSFEGDVESSHLHTFILGAILVMGGVEVALTGFLIESYAVIHGYESGDRVIGKLMKYSNLEILLVIGTLLFAGGVVSGLAIISRWVAGGFGYLSEISSAITSLVLVVGGIQVFLFAVFLSMMLLNENSRHS